ncbi:MAG: T9SS type A sorting domain-containing protein [Chitinophagales bacterium]
MGKDCITGIQGTSNAKIEIEYDPDSKIAWFQGIKSNEGVVFVFNSTGQLVLSKNIQAGIALHLSFLNSGFYLIQLRAQEQFLVKKIIVK